MEEQQAVKREEAKTCRKEEQAEQPEEPQNPLRK